MFRLLTEAGLITIPFLQQPVLGRLGRFTILPESLKTFADGLSARLIRLTPNYRPFVVSHRFFTQSELRIVLA